MTPKRNPFLQASLILLMVFANSGFAAGSAGHGHSHDFSLDANSMAPQLAIDAHADHDMMHGSMTIDTEPHSTQKDTKDNLHSHEGEDCVCDDICCLSTVSLFDSSIDSTIQLDDNQLVKPRQFYQSISLDLLLPPPTR